MQNSTIEYRKGNLLDVTEGVIAHGCNMQGVMGAGVALAIKKKYPECFELYRDVVNECSLGDCIWYYPNSPLHSNFNLAIANALTQTDFGTGSRQVNYAAVAKAFTSIFELGLMYGGLYKTVNFPKIGAGLGGGDWGIISAIIEDCDPMNQIKKICWEL